MPSIALHNFTLIHFFSQGDVSPVTVAGKIFANILACLGIICVAIPVGIVINGMF